MSWISLMTVNSNVSADRSVLLRILRPSGSPFTSAKHTGNPTLERMSAKGCPLFVERSAP